MKRLGLSVLVICVVVAGCATVQSIIKSTFPYTAILTIPANTKSNVAQTVSSGTSSFDEIFGNQNGTSYIKDVRVASARLDANNPTRQSLGIFKSVKLFLVNANGSEVMVASRSDVSENIGNNLVLDIDNSRFVDDYIRGSKLKVRMEYVLRNSLASEVSVRAAVNFSASPNQ